jgi:hypothetical protein
MGDIYQVSKHLRSQGIVPCWREGEGKGAREGGLVLGCNLITNKLWEDPLDQSAAYMPSGTTDMIDAQ